MNERRMRLKIALAKKKEEKIDLAAKAARLNRQLEAEVMPASAVPLEELRTGDILALAGELHETVEAYKTLLADIREIEAELE